MPPLVELCHISHSFRKRSGAFGMPTTLEAVSDLQLDIFPGETLGLVGESGCGKSTLGKIAVGLLPPSGGDVRVDGVSLYGPVKGAEKLQLDGARSQVQMVFQDPFSSLNPRMRIGESVGEPLLCGRIRQSKSEREAAVIAMLEQVGIRADQARLYPHEFSGGQRQRIAIARALIKRPRFVVCDEPTSSLDSSVQAQVLNLLREMQNSFGLSYLFVSHDLSVIRHMSDRVAVMYRGQIVELARTAVLFGNPLHPYTRLLFSAMPEMFWHTAGVEGSLLHEAASMGDNDASFTGTGCSFAEKCPEAMKRCMEATIPLYAVADRFVRCCKHA